MYQDQGPLFLHCCPWWLMSLAPIREIEDAYYWSEKNALGNIYTNDNPMTVGARQALKTFDAGYNTGLHERLENERQKAKQKNKS